MQHVSRARAIEIQCQWGCHAHAQINLVAATLLVC